MAACPFHDPQLDPAEGRWCLIPTRAWQRPAAGRAQPCACMQALLRATAQQTARLQLQQSPGSSNLLLDRDRKLKEWAGAQQGLLQALQRRIVELVGQ